MTTAARSDQELYERLRHAVVEVLRVPPEQVTRDARFLEDLGATSIDVATLVMILEDELELDLPFDDFRDVHTIGDTIAFIQERLGASN